MKDEKKHDPSTDQNEQGYEEPGEEGESSDPKGKKNMKSEYKKSEDLSEDDLEKSLDMLAQYAENSDGVSRKETLLSKANSEDLTKGEREELFEILGGGAEVVETEAAISTEITKSFSENASVQAGVEVSDFLKGQHSELIKSLGFLAGSLEKSDSRQQEFNLVLARAVSNMGRMNKSLADRLGEMESQPARGPKSMQRPLEKSFVGTTPPNQGEQLSKSQTLDVMEEMLQKGVDAPGVRLDVEATKLESGNAMSKAAVEAVSNYVRENRAVH